MRDQFDLMRDLVADLNALEPVFFALGDHQRVLLLTHLMQAQDGQPLCVQELATLTQLSRPAVSHHLKILKEAGIVAVAKQGQRRYYRLAPLPDQLAQVTKLAADLNQLQC